MTTQIKRLGIAILVLYTALFLKLNQETTVFPTGPDERALLLIPGISFSSIRPSRSPGGPGEAFRGGVTWP